MKKNIPELRFKEFTEEWETKKLGEVCFLQGGYAFKSDNFKKDDGIAIIRISNIKNNSISKKDIVYCDASFEVPNEFEVNSGDVLIAMSGATTGKVGKYNYTEKSYLNQRVGNFKLLTGSSFSKEYLYQLLSSSLFLLLLTKEIVQGGQPNVSGKQLEKLEFLTPTLPEQKKIGKFLSLIDRRIELLEKKRVGWEQYKKGVMQKIFTQEIRFKDEKGENFPDWETKKLGEVGEIITGSTPSTFVKKFWNGWVPWITPTDISTFKYISFSKKKLTEIGLQNTRILPENTLLVTCIASIGKNAILKKKGACNQQINAIVPNKYNDIEFLYYLVENNKNYIENKAGITTIKMVSKLVFSNISFSFPQKEEQTKIADFLSLIDRRIELLKKEEENLKKYKKGLLQKMFVSL